MRYKKILFIILSVLFVFDASADWWARYCYYPAQSYTVQYSSWQRYTSFDDASVRAVYQIPVRSQKNLNASIGLPPSSSTSVVVSNDVDNTVYNLSELTRVSGIVTELRAVQTLWIQDHSLIYQYPFNGFTGVTNGNYVCWTTFSPDKYLSEIYQRATFVQLQSIIRSLSTITTIGSDVSAIVPALESHAATVSNLAAQVDATSTQITNRQAQSNTSLQGIQNEMSSIGSTVSGLPSLISNQSLDTMTIDDLGALWLDLKGVDWQNSATPLPDLLAQNLVSSGLASSVSDAQQKLSDPSWRNSTFVPRVKYSQKKANAIAQLEASGISPPAGKSWRDLEVPELETIFEYQYNTPLADVTEVTTNWLPNIGGKVDDIAGSVGDIRDKVENGIFEVNVMNWPDDFFGFQVTLSNAFAEAFANLSITGRVIELDEDYKRYRDLYGLNGINAPSFDIVFSNAQFLAVGSPNDVNWWRESQNLLSYIAYYGTYNERIYNEISSTNFLAELAAITNRLSVLGDVEATVRRLTDDAIESGEDIKSTLENLTYYRGVSKWCDDYLQAGDTPDRVHLFDLDDHEFYIDIGQSYGFVDLIHGISAFAITLSWICTLPYMIIWLIEWFRKFADFWATKVVGP